MCATPPSSALRKRLAWPKASEPTRGTGATGIRPHPTLSPRTTPGRVHGNKRKSCEGETDGRDFYGPGTALAPRPPPCSATPQHRRKPEVGRRGGSILCLRRPVRRASGRSSHHPTAPISAQTKATAGYRLIRALSSRGVSIQSIVHSRRGGSRNRGSPRGPKPPFRTGPSTRHCRPFPEYAACRLPRRHALSSSAASLPLPGVQSSAIPLTARKRHAERQKPVSARKPLALIRSVLSPRLLCPFPLPFHDSHRVTGIHLPRPGQPSNSTSRSRKAAMKP